MTLQAMPATSPVRRDALRVVAKMVRLLETLTDVERAFVVCTINELLALSVCNTTPQERP